jgi:hypothetical protein
MIQFRTRILKIEEKHHAAWISGLGKEATFSTVSEGWWVTLEGGLSICVGQRKPESIREGEVLIRMDMV